MRVVIYCVRKMLSQHFVNLYHFTQTMADQHDLTEPPLYLAWSDAILSGRHQYCLTIERLIEINKTDLSDCSILRAHMYSLLDQ